MESWSWTRIMLVTRKCNKTFKTNYFSHAHHLSTQSTRGREIYRSSMIWMFYVFLCSECGIRERSECVYYSNWEDSIGGKTGQGGAEKNWWRRNINVCFSDFQWGGVNKKNKTFKKRLKCYSYVLRNILLKLVFWIHLVTICTANTLKK